MKTALKLFISMVFTAGILYLLMNGYWFRAIIGTMLFIAAIAVAES